MDTSLSDAATSGKRSPHFSQSLNLQSLGGALDEAGLFRIGVPGANDAILAERDGARSSRTVGMPRATLGNTGQAARGLRLR